MNRHFTSDSHFNHTNILQYSDRPFADVEEMNEALVERWNAVVAPEDTVYHLGDTRMKTVELAVPYFQRLNGHKVLVPGNHDAVFSGNRPATREQLWSTYAEHFEIWPEQVKLLLANGTVVRLCHFPAADDSREHDRYVDRRPAEDGLPLLHGHTHVKQKLTGPLAFHVGVDAHDFTPVSEDEIITWTEML